MTAEPFESAFCDAAKRAANVTGANPDRALKPVLRSFYAEWSRSKVDAVALKRRLVELLCFLCESRTSANCVAVDHFIQFCDLPDRDDPDIPDELQGVIVDMGMALHDTLTAPEIAANFESTPEQLLRRAQAAPPAERTFARGPFRSVALFERVRSALRRGANGG